MEELEAQINELKDERVLLSCLSFDPRACIVSRGQFGNLFCFSVCLQDSLRADNCRLREQNAQLREQVAMLEKQVQQQSTLRDLWHSMTSLRKTTLASSAGAKAAGVCLLIVLFSFGLFLNTTGGGLPSPGRLSPLLPQYPKTEAQPRLVEEPAHSLARVRHGPPPPPPPLCAHSVPGRRWRHRGQHELGRPQTKAALFPLQLVAFGRQRRGLRALSRPPACRRWPDAAAHLEEFQYLHHSTLPPPCHQRGCDRSVGRERFSLLLTRADITYLMCSEAEQLVASAPPESGAYPGGESYVVLLLPDKGADGNAARRC